MKHLILVPTEKETELLHPKPLPEFAGNGLKYFATDAGIWAVCGVGPAASALAASLLVTQFKPDHVVLLGIAGAFAESGLKPGDIRQVNTDSFADLGYTDENGLHNLDAMGLPMLPTASGTLSCSQDLVLLDDTEEAVPAITVSSITNSEEEARKRYCSFNGALENMEGAAVALACAVHGVSFSQVRAVSNFVGPRDPKSWQVVAPLRRLGAWLRERL